jgi:hypothetical protein
MSTGRGGGAMSNLLLPVGIPRKAWNHQPENEAELPTTKKYQPCQVYHEIDGSPVFEAIGPMSDLPNSWIRSDCGIRRLQMCEMAKATGRYRISRYGLMEYQSLNFGKLGKKREVDQAHNTIISIVSTVYHQIPFAVLFLTTGNITETAWILSIQSIASSLSF